MGLNESKLFIVNSVDVHILCDHVRIKTGNEPIFQQSKVLVHTARGYTSCLRGEYFSILFFEGRIFQHSVFCRECLWSSKHLGHWYIRDISIIIMIVIIVNLLKKISQPGVSRAWKRGESSHRTWCSLKSKLIFNHLYHLNNENTFIFTNFYLRAKISKCGKKCP